jgi:hypothetical protein
MKDEEIDFRWLFDEIIENIDEDTVVVFRPEEQVDE